MFARRTTSTLSGSRHTREGLEVALLLQFQDGPADLLLQVAALLHGDCEGLLGKRLPDLGEVAVLVELVANLQ